MAEQPCVCLHCRGKVEGPCGYSHWRGIREEWVTQKKTRARATRQPGEMQKEKTLYETLEQMLDAPKLTKAIISDELRKRQDQLKAL